MPHGTSITAVKPQCVAAQHGTARIMAVITVKPQCMAAPITVKPQCMAAPIIVKPQCIAALAMKTNLTILLIAIATWSCQQKPKLMGTTIKIGESITHELEGNPTTGYTWEYKLDTPEIVKISEEVSSENKEGMVGTPSKFKYKIEGVKKGSTQIIFTYQRSWEKEVAPAQTDTLVVNIE